MTIYEENLKATYAAFDKYQGAELNGETLPLFFPSKVAMPVTRLSLFPYRKNAIILVGQSCIGKTTFAREFIKAHPVWTYISMDECTDFSKPEDEFSGVDIFGKKLEKGYPNILIDGGWLYITARGALLKTLEELGYHTCIFLCTISERDHLSRIQERCLEFLVPSIIHIPPADMFKKPSPIERLAKEYNLSVEETKKRLCKHPNFKESFNRDVRVSQEELVNSNYIAQISSGLIFYGADELLIVAM